MTTLSADALSRLSGLLYEAACDDDQWAQACENLRQAFNCKAASLLIKQGQHFVRIHGDCDPYYSELYWSDLVRHDPLQAGPACDPRCNVYTDQSVLDKRDFLKSVMYNEWFAPQHLRGVLLLKVFNQTGAHAIFTLNRSTRQSDFDAHDIAVLQALEPVFSQAISIRQHVALLRLQARASTFEQMHIAHLIVNRQRQVLHMNTTADQLSAMAATPVSIAQGRLTLGDRRSAHALEGLIARACMDAAAQAQDAVGELLLHAERGPSLLLSVHPFMDAMAYGINGRYVASIVMRTLVIHGLPRMKARLQNLFGLSAREAELAVMLVDGYSLQEAAAQRQVSITTVRSQLACLFRKTGTTRQGQLIALLGRLG